MLQRICELLDVTQQQGTPRSETVIVEGVTYRLTTDGQHVEQVTR